MKMTNRFYTNFVRFVTPFVKFLYPYRLQGNNKLPEGAAVVCANHSNLIDPFLVAIVFGAGNYMRFMGKVELFKTPLIGWLCRKLGGIPVDRDGSDIEAFRASVEVLKTGNKLMLFPEGTRVSTDDAVAAKTGAVRLAARHDAAIIPVYISRGKKIFHKVDVCIGEPYTLGKIKRTEYAAAAEELMDRIAAMNPEKK